MSPNNHIKRLPNKPLSDVQYFAKYGKPRKCLFCTNSNRECTGGKPCDRCKKNKRICTNLITKLPFVTPSPTLNEKKAPEINDGIQADLSNNEEQDGKPKGLLGEIVEQELDGYSWEDYSDGLEYYAQDVSQFPGSFVPTAYAGPTHSKAEDEIALVQARDRGNIIIQPQFPPPPPQTVSETKVFEIRDSSYRLSVGSHPESTFGHFHEPGMHNAVTDFDGLERNLGDVRDW